jgi:methionyl aminopeptidase
MRIVSNQPFKDNFYITLKNKEWLDKQRVAGKIVAQTLNMLHNLVKEKTKLSCLELNSIAEEYIVKSGAIPTFKGYKGFPAGVCISINKELVHGIPKNIFLQEGDVVSFDLGATVDGVIADSALTCIYGEPKSEKNIKLITTNEEALMKGIQAIKVGNKLGCIGNAISKHIKNNGFGIIDKYGGHGIDLHTPHASPFVANKSSVDEGITIQPGLVIAIEPMSIIGDTYTYVSSDGWTVFGQDISCHAEHTVFVHEDHVEIVTSRDNL